MGLLSLCLMTTLEWLLVAYAVIFCINVVPYFMPATWTVVAFFLLTFGLPFWPLCVGAAVASTGGRCLLAFISSRWGRHLLSARNRQNVSALGTWLNKRASWRGVLEVFLYSMGPIPSNQIFIAVGLAKARIQPVALGFFAGRLLSYPFFAATAKGVNEHFDNIFLRAWRDPKTLVLELLSIVAIVAFTKIDWPRLLHIPMPAGVNGDRAATQPRSTA
jgi:membrane protein YqaA with SNARE-associated domain